MSNDALEDKDTLRPICFVIMPYGKKPTMSDKGPVTIDYNALWDKAFLPFIETDLKYTAIRADQDLGAMIIKEMIERLTLADLVIAEISTPNSNVYYEIGVRHAAKETGCVLISADWAKQPFDAEQMRQTRYPLAEGEILDDTAIAVRKSLNNGVKGLIAGRSPVYASVPGYPVKADKAQTDSFRKQVQEISKFSAELRTIRLKPAKERDDLITAITVKYRDSIIAMPGIAMEIIYLLRDSALWADLVEFINQLPEDQKNLAIIKEIYNLALSKTGDHLAAIAALTELIKIGGESSERRGLIGGRYKKLYKETKDVKYLSQAIAEYDKGMRLDLNDYFPSCNLPRLLRTRARAGDDEKARAAATVALMACERSRAINTADEWLLPTMLAMAFDSGDVNKASDLYNEMLDSGPQPFQLDTTIADLDISLSLIKDEVLNNQLLAILNDMKKLLPEGLK